MILLYLTAAKMVSHVESLLCEIAFMFLTRSCTTKVHSCHYYQITTFCISLLFVILFTWLAWKRLETSLTGDGETSWEIPSGQWNQRAEAEHGEAAFKGSYMAKGKKFRSCIQLILHECSGLIVFVKELIDSLRKMSGRHCGQPIMFSITLKVHSLN